MNVLIRFNYAEKKKKEMRFVVSKTVSIYIQPQARIDATPYVKKSFFHVRFFKKFRNTGFHKMRQIR